MGILRAVLGQRNTPEVAADMYRDLIRREAKIGATVFGPVPKGTKREFFCLDTHTWVWHEEWTDQFGNHQVRTTNYHVRRDGLLKSSNGGSYQRVSPAETRRFKQAVEVYGERINQQLYSGRLAI